MCIQDHAMFKTRILSEIVSLYKLFGFTQVTYELIDKKEGEVTCTSEDGLLSLCIRCGPEWPKYVYFTVNTVFEYKGLSLKLLYDNFSEENGKMVYDTSWSFCQDTFEEAFDDLVNAFGAVEVAKLLLKQ